jgi:hypothetical protein
MTMLAAAESTAPSFGRDRVPVGTRARGEVRRFKARLDAEDLGGRAEASQELNQVLMAAVLKNTDRGRYRAADRARRLFPQLRLESIQPRLAIFSYLGARPALLVNPREPGEAQDAVNVFYLLASAGSGRHNVSIYAGFWTLEIADHALGRLAMRSPGANFRAAIYEAHAWALRARVPTPIPSSVRTVLLPALGGAFLARFIAGRDSSDGQPILYLRVRTWIPADKLRSDQHPLETGAPALGSSFLLPQPLRELTVRSSEMTAVPRRPS